MTEDVGVVVLNYINHEETKEMLDSLKKHYPLARTVIVDNGSPLSVVDKLNEYSKQYTNVSVLPLPENTGFARGNNAGIKLLKAEGYKFICCSNSDIIILEKGVLESLKINLLYNNAAIAGPKIAGEKGGEYKPKINRPSMDQAKKGMRNLTIASDILLYIQKKHFKTIKKLRRYTIAIVKKLFIINKADNKKVAENQYIKNTIDVYTLHGSFIMFGPSFFEYYEGFDEHTFLYGEEAILGEMLLIYNLKAVYVPEFQVYHKEGKTTGLTIKRKWFLKRSYVRQSARYWYYHYYLKNNG
jgi:GT2 family glycosyltransferase